MDIFILALAVWRVSNLFIDESGPCDMFERFRSWVGVGYNERGESYATNELAELFTCHFCLSVWLGAFAAILYYFYPALAYWLCLPFALSALSLVVNKWMR